MIEPVDKDARHESNRTKDAIMKVVVIKKKNILADPYQT